MNFKKVLAIVAMLYFIAFVAVLMWPAYITWLTPTAYFGNFQLFLEFIIMGGLYILFAILVGYKRNKLIIVLGILGGLITIGLGFLNYYNLGLSFLPILQKILFALLAVLTVVLVIMSFYVAYKEQKTVSVSRQQTKPAPKPRRKPRGYSRYDEL